MTDDKLEEETYSLIYTSLKHPFRRKILRMLKNGPLTFSEILQAVEIDSGHLSYHLENLGDLVNHSSDGKYQLSTIGLAAVKLMGGVEEHSHGLPKPKLKLTDTFARVYPFLLSGALIIAGMYFVTYATTATEYSQGIGFLYATANVTTINVTTSKINQTVFVVPDAVLNSTTELNVTTYIMDLGPATPITVAVSWQQQERPYFYYGLAGLVIASVYPAFVLIGFARRLRRYSKPERKTRVLRFGPGLYLIPIWNAVASD